MRRRRLPPLNPLKSFEAAARHVSFAKAAEELNVSPVAVSRQVQVLEEYFSVTLFERQPRMIQLTPAGQAFLPEVTAALDLLDKATEGLRRFGAADMLTVCTYPSFALNWLIPRLHKFRAAYPDIEINISTAVKPAEFDHNEIDIAILFTNEAMPELRREAILPDVIQPVCSPALLEGPYPPTTPEHLRHHTLLHSRYRRLDWGDWLDAAGHQEIEPANELTFKGSRLAYQAAMEGLGVAVAQRLLVAKNISAGQLVLPLQPAVQRAVNYCLTYRPERLENRSVQAFRDWIHAEADQNIEELGLPSISVERDMSNAWLEAINL